MDTFFGEDGEVGLKGWVNRPNLEIVQPTFTTLIPRKTFIPFYYGASPLGALPSRVRPGLLAVGSPHRQ